MMNWRRINHKAAPGRIARHGFLASLIVCAGLTGAAVAQELEGTLLVANRDGGSVSFFDLTTRLEMARLPIGPVIPHEIAVSPDGRWALTGEYGPGDDRGQRLVVIDVANAQITGRIDLGPESRPHSMMFLPDSRHAIATLEDSDTIALVDIVDLEVLDTWPTGGRDGHMVRLSPDGARAYVTSRGAEGTLSVISLDDDSDPVVIATDMGAEGLAVTPDGSEVWVVNRTVGTISIVDTGSLSVVETVDARPGAGRAEISPGGRALVPNGSAGQETARYLTLFDIEDRSVLGELAINDGEPGPGAFGIHIFGETAFVADRAERSIAIYDLENFPAAQHLASDLPNPDGLGYSPLRLAVFTR